MSDILVALPPSTANGEVIFGKNSNRPPSEVQEVVYLPATDQSSGTSLKCTFLEVEQVGKTYGVILSKAAWSWGAEMGANDQGVCIGNTAVWTKLCNQGNQDKKLIGGDFVRLGLERGGSAKEALDIITSHLEKYGQSGPCCEDPAFSQWTYDNSFIIADNTEAWVLETAGQNWAAEKISKGVRNISSCLTISTTMDAMSNGLKDTAQSLGFWKPDDGDFDFAKVFGSEYTGMAVTDAQKPENRLLSAQALLETQAKGGKFSLENMFSILRDEKSCINYQGNIITMASQVSVLRPRDSKSQSSHWFTATPNPSMSFFKPFIFSTNPVIGKSTVSPAADAGFQATEDRRHLLYKMHEKGRQLMSEGSQKGQALLSVLQSLERECIDDLQEFLKNCDDSKTQELFDLFKDIVDSEIKFYK